MAVDELVDGVDELADHNTELTDAADELFDAMLEQVNDSLKDVGVEVTLTSGNYEQQLNAMIANPHPTLHPCGRTCRTRKSLWKICRSSGMV